MCVLPCESLQPPGQDKGGQGCQAYHPQAETGHRAGWQGLGTCAGADAGAGAVAVAGVGAGSGTGAPSYSGLDAVPEGGQSIVEVTVVCQTVLGR